MKIQGQVFWVMAPCNIVVVYITAVKIQVQVFWVVTPCSVTGVKTSNFVIRRKVL
jgi:hypothetical protein